MMKGRMSSLVVMVLLLFSTLTVIFSGIVSAMNDEQNLSGIIWLSDGSTPPSQTGFAIWVEWPSGIWNRYPDTGWYPTSDVVNGTVWYSFVLPDEDYNITWADGASYAVEVDGTPWGEMSGNATSNGTGSDPGFFPATYDPTNPANSYALVNHLAGGGYEIEQQWDVRTAAPRDLIPTNVTVDGINPDDYPAGIPVGGGSDVNISFKATNIGLLDTGGTFNVSAWLSDANGQPIAFIWENLSLGPLNEYGNLSGNGYYTGTLNFTWTVPLQPGDYYINITVDSSYDIRELNETNNTIILHFIVGPDLIPIDVTVDGIGYPDWPQISPIILPAPGQWIHIEINLTNVGATSTGPTAFNVVFYEVSIIDFTPIGLPFYDSGYVFSNISVGAIDGAVNGTCTADWYAPAPGEFRINLTVDFGFDGSGTVAELNETNNTYVLRVLVGPDIIPTNVTANGIFLTNSPSTPIPVGLGQTIPIGANATNVGFSPTGGTIWVGFYNSTIDGMMLNQPYYNTTAPELNASWEPGNTSFVTGGYWTAPPIAGTYYVTIYVDIANNTYEFNETNNTFVICFVVGPDLIPINISVNGTDANDPTVIWYASSGDIIIIGSNASNVGASPTGVQFNMTFWNCSSGGVNNGTPFVVFTGLGPLNVWENTSHHTAGWEVPNQPGDYYVNITVDSHFDASESVEWNNTFILHFRVGPDYIPWNVSVNGSDANDPNKGWNVSAGDTIIIGVNASNVGVSGSSILFNISFANSTDPLNPFYVKYNIPGITAGGTSSHYTTTWTAPNQVGDYYIIITIDYGNSTWELDETNNTFVLHIVIGPDYIPTNLEVDGVPVPVPDPFNPIPVGAGIPVNIGVETMNIGLTGVAPTILYNISFSLNGTRFDNVTDLPGLIAGGFSGLQLGTWIPPNAAGVYAMNVTVDSDNSTSELNETNNTITIYFIVAPDYIPGYVTVDGQYAWDESLVWNVTPGVPVIIGVNCTNVGVSGVNASITYMISCYNSDAARTIGFEFDNVPALPGLPAGGNSGQQTGTWIPPNQPGHHYVLVYVDSSNTTSEINEYNNTFLLHFVIGPDLIPTNVSVNGEAALTQSQIWYVGPGELITIGANATNVGYSGTGTAFNISLYNVTIPGVPFNITISALNASEDSGHVTWQWTVPVIAGDYYVNITVDYLNASVWELNELNNTFTLHFVVAPDLTPNNVTVDGVPITSYPFETVIVYPGQIILIGANASNVGLSSTGIFQFNMTFWNSSASGQTMGALLFDSGLLGPLDAGAFSPDHYFIWVAPSPDKPTDYYINITVDSSWNVSEWVETNNTYILHIRVDAPDLTPDRVEVEANGTIYAVYDEPYVLSFVSEEIFIPVGSDLNITFTIANIGGIDQIIGTNVTAYNISGIGGPPIDIPFYESGSEDVNLTSGASISVTIIWSNPGISGLFYFNVSIDYNGTLDIGGRIIELNETNNTFTFLINITSKPITTLLAGIPTYQPGGYWYVNSSTELNFSVTGQNPPFFTYYRVYNMSNGSYATGWINYTDPVVGGNFTMIWGEGTFLIEFNSTDSIGGAEPTKTRIIIVDDSLPFTNVIVGAPQYNANPPDILNVTNSTSFDLSAADLPLGVSPAGPGILNASGINGIPESGLFYRIQNLSTGLNVTDWLEYSTGTPFYLNDPAWGDGYYRIWFNSTDNLGQKEIPKYLDVYLDNTGPITTIDVGDPNWTAVPGDRINVTSSTPFTLDAYEAMGSGANLSTVRYRVYNEDTSNYETGWITTLSFDLSGLGLIDGNYTILFRAQDNLGNLGPTGTLDIYVDNTPPVTVLVVGDPKYRKDQVNDIWNITSSTNLTLIADDGPGCGVNFTQYRIYNATFDTGWIDYTGNFTLPAGWDDGVYTLEYNSTDHLGNNMTYSTDIYLDSSPPTSMITIGDPKYPSTPIYNITGETPINLTATDGMGSGVASIYYQIYNDSGLVLDWKEYAPGTGFFNLSGYGDGNYTIVFNATDNLGNVEIPSNSYVIYLDNTGPITNITVGDPKYRGSVSDNWNVTSQTPFTLDAYEIIGSGANISTIQYRINNTDTGNTSGWITDTSFDIATDYPLWATEGDGNYTIEFRATDNLGNPGPTGSIDIYVDDTPPVTVLIIGEPKYRDQVDDIWNISSDTDLDFWTDDGPGCGVNFTEYRIYNGTYDSGWFTHSITFNLSGLSLYDGFYTIEYRSSDYLGNNQTSNETIYLDNTWPTTTISVGFPKYPIGGVLLNVTDATLFTFISDDGQGCGVAYTRYRIYCEDNATYVSNWIIANSFTFSGFGLDDGNYTIEFYSADFLINVEPTNYYTTYLDNSPPVTIIDIGEPKYRVNVSDLWNVTIKTEFYLYSDDGFGSGVYEIYYQIENSTWFVSRTYNGTFFLITGQTRDAEGGYTIRYWAVDNVFNPEQVHEIRVVVDKTPPATNITFGDPRYRANVSADILNITDQTPINITSVDGGMIPVGLENVWYMIDTDGNLSNGNLTGWIIYDGVFNMSGFGDGDYWIYYHAVDLLNNVENIKNAAIVVDSTPPVTELGIEGTNHTKPEAGNYTWWIKPDTDLTLSASDIGVIPVGLNYTTYNLDGRWYAFFDGFEMFNLYRLENGSHQIRYRSVDYIGNAEELTFVTIIIDDAGPEIDLTSSPDVQLPWVLPKIPTEQINFSEITNLTVNATDMGVPLGEEPSGVWFIQYLIDPEDPNAFWQNITPGTYNIFDLVGEWYQNVSRGYWHHNISFRAFDNLGWEGPVITIWFYIEGDVIPPLPPVLRARVSGGDIILEWDPSPSDDIAYYLIYRSTSKTGFDFSEPWVDTHDLDLGQDPVDGLVIPLRTTWNDTLAVIGPEEYYYTIRGVDNRGNIGYTSNIAGKVTITFERGYNTFSLPLEPFENITASEMLSEEVFVHDSDTLYRYNVSLQQWMGHTRFMPSSLDNFILEMGEGYMIYVLEDEVRYTFTGSVGTSIRFIDGVGNETGFRNSLTAQVDGNVVDLNWSSTTGATGYSIYRATERMGNDSLTDYSMEPYAKVSAQDNSWTDTEAYDEEYYYLVVAEGSEGESSGTYALGVKTYTLDRGYSSFSLVLEPKTPVNADSFSQKFSADSDTIYYYEPSTGHWYGHSRFIPQNINNGEVVTGRGYMIFTYAETTRISVVGV